MRNPQRELSEQDPYRTLVQSDAWNIAVLVWSLGSPAVILALSLCGFFPDWTWKETTAVMMLAFASGTVLCVLGWIYERVKYPGR